MIFNLIITHIKFIICSIILHPDFRYSSTSTNTLTPPLPITTVPLLLPYIHLHLQHSPHHLHPTSFSQLFLSNSQSPTPWEQKESSLRYGLSDDFSSSIMIENDY